MKWKTILSCFAVGIGIFAMVLVVRAWKSLGQPIPQLEVKRAEPEEPDMFYLSTASVSDDVRSHLLDGDFKIVRRVNEIPTSCRLIFESSFKTASGSRAKPGTISLADPGESFQASDNIVPGLPFRRLELAGLGGTKCFLHYQNGGQMFVSFCLAVIDYPNQQTIWVGEFQKVARNMDELRRMILQRQFGDTAGRAC
jgi:hypothetical protein